MATHRADHRALGVVYIPVYTSFVMHAAVRMCPGVWPLALGLGLYFASDVPSALRCHLIA